MKTKLAKVLALLLALVLVLGMFAGCSNSTNTDTNQPADSTTTPDATDATDTPDDTTPADDTTEPDDSTTTESRPNRLIYGVGTQLSGDVCSSYFANNATDDLIRTLMFGLSTVALSRDAEYVIDDTVVKEFSVEEDEEAGTKTFTFTINEGLTYNNGEPITAADYVASLLITCNPTLAAVGSNAYPDYIVGGIEYQSGETDVLTGVHLIDEYTFSYSITADYANYYYALYYASVSPDYLPNWGEGLSVVATDEGVKLEGEITEDDITNQRWDYDSPVTSGPYVLKSLDTAAYTATLEINPYYPGNYEGQKPSIQQLIIAYTPADTQFDALTTGGVDFLDTLSEGTYIDQALDLVEAGGYDYVSFDRAGYGFLGFVCDGGPTQFTAVRQAIAYLLDRSEFATTFTSGYGSVVNGPYGVAQIEYKESEEVFAETLNSYDYNPSKAVELLEADGWVLNADGSDYSGSGLRYKEVTPEEAGDYEYNVTLSDGRILMPLEINWLSSEGNSVSDLLATMLANGAQTAEAGIVIHQEVVAFSELLNWYYRQTSVDEKYGKYKYGMFNLASGFYAAYDLSWSYSMDESVLAMGYYNTNWLLDEELSQTAWDMVYGGTDWDTHLDNFQRFIIRWNELVPDIPLYSNIYHTIFRDWLKGYEEDAYWTFAYGVLYAYIEGAE